MSQIAPLSPVAPLGAAAGQPASTAELARRGQIEETAAKFESAFLSIMMQQMFTATETPSPFGGGQGEQMFRSFLTEAFAEQTVKSGGLGIADTVAREMLKLQGLDQE
jgi:Rod binding domain-containing protein